MLQVGGLRNSVSMSDCNLIGGGDMPAVEHMTMSQMAGSSAICEGINGVNKLAKCKSSTDIWTGLVRKAEQLGAS